MFFWGIAGALALIVGALLIMAMLRTRAQSVVSGAALDVQVYRDQLGEVERDLARGVITPEEADRVRVEVSRRLLEADKQAGSARQATQAPQGVSVVGGIAVGLVVIGGAFGLYTQIGAPGYPDLPLKLRLEMAGNTMAIRPTQAVAEANIDTPFTPAPDLDPQFLDLMAKLRAAVKENPEELRGQMLLARNESVIGNYAAAYKAQAKAIALKGDDAQADDYGTLADLMILTVNGYVSPEAEAALKTALEMDPRNGPARYYSGLMYAQNGRPDLAFRIWRGLLEQSRPEAPWYQPIAAQIEQLAALAGVRYALPTAPVMPPAGMPPGRGPSAADMAAASDMTAEDRQAMIRSMVDGLAERLADEGGPPTEWARLITALGVLGDTERAGAIWTEAQSVFGASAEAMAILRPAAEGAGVVQ